MSQWDILKILEDNADKKYTHKELAKKLNVTVNSISRCASRLRKFYKVNTEYVRIRSKHYNVIWVDKKDLKDLSKWV
jgi:hypothetical protein